jgi:hypothetical protein
MAADLRSLVAPRLPRTNYPSCRVQSRFQIRAVAEGYRPQFPGLLPAASWPIGRADDALTSLKSSSYWWHGICIVER